MNEYQKDLTKAVDTAGEFLKYNIWIELAEIANNSKDFEEFKKMLLTKVISIVKTLEDQKLLEKGTTEKVIKGELK